MRRQTQSEYGYSESPCRRSERRLQGLSCAFIGISDPDEVLQLFPVVRGNWQCAQRLQANRQSDVTAAGTPGLGFCAHSGASSGKRWILEVSMVLRAILFKVLKTACETPMFQNSTYHEMLKHWRCFFNLMLLKPENVCCIAKYPKSTNVSKFQSK